MKALPVKLIYGQGYEPCAIEEATHVTLNIPGPTGLLTLPVILSGTRAGTGCWTWNGSTDAPTLRPSVLTTGTTSAATHGSTMAQRSSWTTVRTNSGGKPCRFWTQPARGWRKHHDT